MPPEQTLTSCSPAKFDQSSHWVIWMAEVPMRIHTATHRSNQIARRFMLMRFFAQRIFHQAQLYMVRFKYSINTQLTRKLKNKDANFIKKKINSYFSRLFLIFQTSLISIYIIIITRQGPRARTDLSSVVNAPVTFQY